LDVTIGGGIYAIGSQGPPSGKLVPPPKNFLNPINWNKLGKWPPAKWFNIPVRHGAHVGCPQQGLRGQICAVASVGFGGWSVGARACYQIPGGNVWGTAGMNIGAGTGVAVQGGVTYTFCGSERQESICNGLMF